MAYLYRHIRLDKNQPFYIGIGSDETYKRAFAKKKGDRNKIWHGIVAKTDYEVEILLDGLTYSNVIEKEKEFIALYGRIDKHTGCLCNLTDGGEGVLGILHTEETKRKLSQKIKGCKHTSEAVEKIRQTSKRPCSEEKKHKISLSNKGRKMTIEQREKLSIAKTGVKISDETKEKLRIAQTGKKYSAETREKIRNVVKEIWRKRKENKA
jgi:hypothetical protein